MKDYRLFEMTDFVMDEDFIKWVLENNPADNHFWNNWLIKNPDKHLVIAEARQILQSLKVEQEVVSEQKVQLEVDRLIQTIQLQPQQLREPAPVFSFSSRWWLAAASVLVIAMVGTLYFVNQQRGVFDKEQFKYTSQISSQHLIEHINTSGEKAPITLPDGSIVQLAPDSRISYANRLDTLSTRDVYLSGEAFFSVVKNPEKPFRVFSNEIITKVLGTTFTVRSFDKDSVIQITVKTGKVSVYTQANSPVSKEITSKKLGGILLTSNQQLVYAKAAQTFQKIVADCPAIVIPGGVIEQRMAYEDVPLEEVFNELSRAYGIDIVYDTEILKNCTVTADIRNETFYRQLDLICDAVGAKYELMDGQVVIQSKGCQ